MSSMRRSLDASSVFSDDLAEYDIISDGHRSLDSSIADLGLVDGLFAGRQPTEPPPSQAARELFSTPSLSAEDIRSNVRRALQANGGHVVEDDRIVRVYVDGRFDPMNAG